MSSSSVCIASDYGLHGPGSNPPNVVIFRIPQHTNLNLYDYMDFLHSQMEIDVLQAWKRRRRQLSDRPRHILMDINLLTTGRI